MALIFLLKIQSGRRYFPRREITALVGSPGNMAVYRHIFVVPPTAKVSPSKNETAYRQNITAVLHCHRKIPPYFGFTASGKKYRQKVPPTLNTAKRVPPTLDTVQTVQPTLDTAQKVPSTLDIAQKVSPILDTAEKVPRKLDTARTVPAFLLAFVLCSFWFFLVLLVPFR